MVFKILSLKPKQVDLTNQPLNVVVLFSSIYPNPDPSAPAAAQAAVCDSAAASDLTERSGSALRGRCHSSPHRASCGYSACPASSASAVSNPFAAQSACYLPTSHHLPLHYCESAGTCPEWTNAHTEPHQSTTSTTHCSQVPDSPCSNSSKWI